jgi:hypothetical protein
MLLKRFWKFPIFLKVSPNLTTGVWLNNRFGFMTSLPCSREYKSEVMSKRSEEDLTYPPTSKLVYNRSQNINTHRQEPTSRHVDTVCVLKVLDTRTDRSLQLNDVGSIVHTLVINDDIELEPSFLI